LILARLNAKYFKIFVILILIPIFAGMKQTLITFKTTPHFKEFVEKQAKRAKLSTSKYIKEVVKKHSKYKEPELI